MPTSNTSPRRSKRLQGLQPPEISPFDPFGNDLLHPLPLTPINDQDPPSDTTPQDTNEPQPQPDWLCDDNSSLLLSYANSSPSVHPNSESSSSYNTYTHTTSHINQSNDYDLLSQNMNTLNNQVSMLTTQLESIINTPNPTKIQIPPTTPTVTKMPDPPSCKESTHPPMTPANNSTHTSSRTTKPDPPEDKELPIASATNTVPIIAHATITTPYLKQTTTSTPSKLPPAATPTFIPPMTHIPMTIPSPPPGDNQNDHTAPSTTPPAPTTTIVYPKDIKLTLSSYKQGHNYIKWKRLCLIEISCNTKYDDIVITTNNGLKLNPHMSKASSRALFLATTKALGSLVDNYISSSDIGQADGYSLWDTLDQSETNKESTLVQRQSLIRNFATITKHRNESIEQYTTRFETKLDELRLKNLTTPSESELVCQYISSLKMNKIFADTLRKFDEATWYVDLSWIKIMLWCKNEISVYHTINGTTPDPPPPRNQPNQQRNDTPTPTPRPRNQPNNRQNHPTNIPRYNPPPCNNNNRNNTGNERPRPNNQNQYDMQRQQRNNDQPTYNPPPPSPFLLELTADLQRTSNPEAIFRYLHNTYPTCCPIHNDAPHPILDCYLLSRTCRECGTLPQLMEVKRSVGLLPPREQGGSNHHTYHRQAPAPAPPSQPPQPSNTNNNTPRTNNTTNTTPTNAPTQQTPNPYRRQNQTPYVPYNPSMNNNARSNARRTTNDNDTPITDNADEYYNEHDDHFDTNDDYNINVENNTSNNDLNVYPSTVHAISRKTVTFAPNTKPPKSPQIITTSQYNPKTTKQLPTIKSLYRFVLDSGATDHMSPFKAMFESITYYDQHNKNSPKVLLGDDKTEVSIHGHGYINIMIHGKRIRTHALYIPSMGETCLYSIRQHMRYEGCIFHAEAHHCSLSFPNFIISPRITKEIDVLSRSVVNDQNPYDFDEDTAQHVPTTMTHSSLTTKQTDKRYSKLSLISQTKSEYIPQNTYSQFSEDVYVKRLVPHATIPSTATPGAIGHDVTCTAPITINPSTIAKIPTGLSTSLPTGMYIRIADRSSKALQGMTVKGGVIDSDYRGEIMVLLRNDTYKPITINTGDKIAQFIFERAATPFLRITNTLPHSLRNKGGFGSTDITPPSRIKTFCLENNDVLILDTNNHRKPRLRRINTRNTSSLISPNHPAPTIDPSTKPTDVPTHTSITHHLLNEKESSPVDSALHQKLPPISPTHHDHSPSTLQEQVPIPLPVDRVNSALPQAITMSRDVLRKSIGFLTAKPLLKYLATTGDKSLKIPPFSDTPSLDPGMTASIKSSRRNTTPSTLPPNYSDVWHLDIGFGPCTAIGGIRYTLMCVDKSSRFKLVYGLKNLTTSLHTAITKFLIDSGRKPQLIRTDFDQKLIGGKTKELLTSQGVKIEAAPPHRQHQNGLVERAWQTIVTMTRNWMASSQLPAKYWFFGVKRACEVLNLMPIKRHDKITTPFEVVYKKKANYRSLFPMFSTAYIKQVQEDGPGHKWKSRSLKCICVGTCPDSDALLFYHPPSKQTLSCADGYRFDSFSPSGPQFGEKI
jgi:dUTP pyrophosphatase